MGKVGHSEANMIWPPHMQGSVGPQFPIQRDLFREHYQSVNENFLVDVAGT